MALLAALRGWLAWSGQLSKLAASVVAEMAVLLGALWGFVSQYETTLPIALRNALFVGVFVLIALRALRFEPVWVWLSGASAAIGWTLLAVAAWRSTTPGERTWYAVVAASTSRLHLGDEAIRVATILIVMAILATALSRARLTLARAVNASQSADALARCFDSEVADQITATDLPPMFAKARHATPRSCSPTCGALPRRQGRCPPPT